MILQATATEIPLKDESVRDSRGRFIKGKHSSPKTEIQKGQRIRPAKPYWDKNWLRSEYCDQRKSALQIANEQGCKENNILFFLKKHDIPTRNMTEIRKHKHWGSPGETNPMYGMRGRKHPLWAGGYTPVRQKLYGRIEGKQFFQTIGHRDGWKCKWCGSQEKLCVHHIIPFRETPLLPLDPGNAIMLCQKCHHKTYRKERRYAKKFFKMIEVD